MVSNSDVEPILDLLNGEHFRSVKKCFSQQQQKNAQRRFSVFATSAAVEGFGSGVICRSRSFMWRSNGVIILEKAFLQETRKPILLTTEYALVSVRETTEILASRKVQVYPHKSHFNQATVII